MSMYCMIQSSILFYGIRVFTTIFIAVTFVLTANAGIINKRDDSPDVQECVDLVKDLTKGLSASDEVLTALQNRENISSTRVYALIGDSVSLRLNYDQAKKVCCGLPKGRLDGNDGKAIFEALESYEEAATSTYQTLSLVQASYKGKLVESIGSTFFKNLPSVSDSFNSCLVDRVPENYLPGIGALTGFLEKEYKGTAKGFGIIIKDIVPSISKLPFAAPSVVAFAAGSPSASLQ